MKQERPDCPHCGAPGPISHGHSWWCRVCSRQWVKIYHPQEQTVHEGIVCPRCNSTYVISNGQSWKCQECGRAWLKRFAKEASPQAPSMIDILNTEITPI